MSASFTGSKQTISKEAALSHVISDLQPRCGDTVISFRFAIVLLRAFQFCIRELCAARNGLVASRDSATLQWNGKSKICAVSELFQTAKISNYWLPLQFAQCIVAQACLKAAVVSVRSRIFQEYNGFCEGGCKSETLQPKVLYDVFWHREVCFCEFRLLALFSCHGSWTLREKVMGAQGIIEMEGKKTRIVNIKVNM